MHQHTNDPAHDSPTSTPASASPSSDGEGFDVMNILADVEKHIQRIKTAQREHDEELNTLEARFQSLKNAEREVEQRRRQVIDERGRLEQVQNALREERANFEQQCETKRVELAQQQQQLAQEREEGKRKQQEIAERFQAIEKQFAELSSLEGELAKERESLTAEQEQSQARQKQLIQHLDARQAELDRRDGDLSEQRRQMELREQEIGAELEGMKQAVQEFEARASKAEKAASESLERTRQAEQQLQSRSMELGKLKQELEATSRLLNAAREEAAKQQREFEKEREQATEMMTELEQSIATEKREREAIASNLTSLQGEHESLAATQSKNEQLRGQLETQVEQLSERLAQREKTLADSQHKLKLAGEKLAEFAEVLREQATQLEQAAAHKITIREQQQEIEHLCNELARYRLAADPEIIDRKDQRIAELTEALRQARGQSPSNDNTAVLEHQLHEYSRALDEYRLTIEQLQVQLTQAKQRASAEVKNEAREAGDAARVAERDARIEELTAEVHRLQHDLNERAESVKQSNAANAAGAQQVVVLQQRVRELEGAPKGDSTKLTKRVQELEKQLAEAQELKERVRELEAELTSAQAKGSRGGAASGGPSSKQLDEKVQRIRAAAEHLQRRRSRLNRVRQLVELRKPKGDGKVSQSASEQIELAQQSIAEARSALAMSEREMMKRWARSRAGVTVSFVAILIALVASASWFLADHFHPPKTSASVTLEARLKNNSLLDGEEGARWSTWHAEMLNDPSFRSALAKRMQERQLPQFATNDALNRVMKDDITVDSIRPGAITITMAGSDEQQLLSALDTLASTLATVSTREAGKRPDAARTVVRGETNEAGATQYAQLTGIALDDQRLMYTAIIFAVTLFVAFLCGIGIYSRLIRAKRIFEEEGRLA